jgi:hypothetical protein
MGDLRLYFAAVLRQIGGRKIVDQGADLGGRYWDRTSDLFGVNADWLSVCVPESVSACR